MLSLTSTLQNRGHDSGIRFAQQASNSQPVIQVASLCARLSDQALPFKYNGLRRYLNLKSRQARSLIFFRAASRNRCPERLLTALKYYIFFPFSVRCAFAKSLRYNGYFNLIRCTARSDDESDEPHCKDKKRRGAHPRKRKPPEAGGRRGKSKFKLLRA